MSAAAVMDVALLLCLPGVLVVMALWAMGPARYGILFWRSLWAAR